MIFSDYWREWGNCEILILIFLLFSWLLKGRYFTCEEETLCKVNHFHLTLKKSLILKLLNVLTIVSCLKHVCGTPVTRTDFTP